MLTKQKTLLGRGAQVESNRLREPKRTTLPRVHSQVLWKVKVKVAQLCPTLCNPMDYTVCGILQARILE